MKDNLKKPDTKIPAIFQKLTQYEVEDTRFLKVKIWIMHTGENLNGSYFSKEVVEKAIPSLANTPILGYVEVNEDNEKDFSDHRHILLVENGEFKIKYAGSAWGVIPESNNAQFEMRVCDDGVERLYLTVEGLLWCKLEDGVDIMNDKQTRSQSMEIHDNYSGEFKDDNLFHFTDFTFYGACILGESVLPAMRSSTVEVQFSYEDLKKDIQEKMEQFKSFQKQSSSSEGVNIDFDKGGNNVDEKLELLQKYNLTQDSLDFSIEEISLEELEVKLQEMTATPEGEPEVDFALTAEQFRDELIAELRVETIKDKWDWEYSRYSYVDYKDNTVYAYDRNDSWRLYGINFTVSGDKVTIDFASAKRYKFDIVPFEEGSTDFSLLPQEALEYELKVKENEMSQQFEVEKEKAIEEVKESFATLETEITELREFKQAKLDIERKEAEEVLFAQYEKLNGVEEFEELKKKASEFSLVDLEKEIALIFVKKTQNFSVKPKERNTVKISVDLTEQKPVSEKPYAHLFEKFATEK